MAKSPTQRSLEELRKRGFLADVVERRIRRHVTKDLFGFIDILALGDNRILGIQATDRTNFSHRVTKILNHENYRKVKESPFEIWVWGWGKMASGGWELREELLA